MTTRLIFVSQLPTAAVAPSRLAVRLPHFVALTKPRVRGYSFVASVELSGHEN
jgi:hypothetical protein